MAHERCGCLRQLCRFPTFAGQRRSAERMSARLKILYIAYPLLPVSEDVAGGAEQVLLTVTREISSQGHDVTVAAADRSSVPGRLLATGPASSRVDDFERKLEHENAIVKHLADEAYDLIHDMSGSFWQRASSISAPLLATLHLPPEFYPADAFRNAPKNIVFSGVSTSQARRFSERLGLEGLEVVTNGIPLERFPFSEVKLDYLLWLGRICEEKAPHVACDIAEQLGIPLILAGQIYPFSYHQQYFESELRAWLDTANIRFIDSPSHAQKIELLRDARALLITSSAEETSSLAAMEAMACGTPGIAFRRGALPEVVQDGVTGFIVDDPEGMSEAVENVGSIIPLACREHVVRCFSAPRVASEYLQLYHDMIQDEVVRTECDTVRT